MTIDLTEKEFRRLLDMVYIGNWVLNSTRVDGDRFTDYDKVEEKLFAYCPAAGMRSLVDIWKGHVFPSRAFEEGGIHEAIADYEDAIFFDILAEELSRRDLGMEDDITDADALGARMDEYLSEFESNGLENVNVEM